MTAPLARGSNIHSFRKGTTVSGIFHAIRGISAKAVTAGTLALFAVVSVVPMMWLALAPSKTADELAVLAPFQFGSFEQYAIAWNNLMLFQDGRILEWLGNSLWYTTTIVLVSCATAIMAGFALTMAPPLFRKTFLIATLIAMIVPPVALVIPLFIEIVAFGLYDSPWSLILTSSFYPFGTFLAYIYFSTSIPKELYEAARIDGCGLFGSFGRIALPLSRGLFGMLAFFSFTAVWVDYFLPFMLLNSGKIMTLPVGLGVLFSSTPALNPYIGASILPIRAPEIALAGLLVAVPVLIVFLASSRLLVRGVLAGAVKN